jgi:hypothetical protein
MHMVKKVCQEVADKYKMEEIKRFLNHNDKPMLYRCLFFLMLNFHKEFRCVIRMLADGLKTVTPTPPADTGFCAMRARGCEKFALTRPRAFFYL